MDKKQIQRENLKNILYSIFDNYGDLSKKIYIVISDVENNKHICEEILKIINKNTPSFIRKILVGYNDDNKNVTVKLKRRNEKFNIVEKYDLNSKDDVVVDIYNMDLSKEKYSYESKFIVDMFVAIGSGCLLWLLTVYRHELNRIGGLLMLLSYVVYLIYLC